MGTNRLLAAAWVGINFLLVSIPPVSAQSNLISNGTFPGGTVYNVSGGGLGGGWVVTKGNVDRLADGAYGIMAPVAGQGMIDLDGSQPGGLSQSFVTQAGAHYQVAFDLSCNPVTLGIKSLAVSAGSVSSLQFSYNCTSTSNWQANSGSWVRQTFRFTASANSTTLTFSSNSASPSVAGPTIADVSAVLVSEADLNSDSRPDILWRNSVTGENYAWFMNGATRLGGAWLPAVQDLSWKIVGLDFFNSDSKPDILWRNSATGENYVWYMDGTTRISGAWIEKVADLDWQIVGTADFNNDDRPDILWRNSVTGENYVWFMNGAVRVSGAWLPKADDSTWTIVGVADFNADTKPDILWRNTATGQNYVWYMNGAARIGGAWLLTVADLNWKIVETRDYNSDSKPDVLWRNVSTGENYVWFMNGAARTAGAWLLGVTDLNWSVVP